MSESDNTTGNIQGQPPVGQGQPGDAGDTTGIEGMLDKAFGTVALQGGETQPEARYEPEMVPLGEPIGTPAPSFTIDGMEDDLAAVFSQFEDMPQPAASSRVRIADIEVRPQVRHTFDERKIEELAESIRTVGQLTPINVEKVTTAEGVRYRLINGERRLRACKLLGMEEVVANVYDLEAAAREGGIDRSKALTVIQIIENLQREDLSLADLVAGVRGLADGGITAQQIARLISRKQTYVYQLLAFGRLDPREFEIMSPVGPYLLQLYLRLKRTHSDIAQRIIDRAGKLLDATTAGDSGAGEPEPQIEAEDPTEGSADGGEERRDDQERERMEAYAKAVRRMIKDALGLGGAREGEARATKTVGQVRMTDKVQITLSKLSGAIGGVGERAEAWLNSHPEDGVPAGERLLSFTARAVEHYLNELEGQAQA